MSAKDDPCLMYVSFKTVQNSSDRFAHGADADSQAQEMKE